jgi:hypothetical protein
LSRKKTPKDSCKNFFVSAIESLISHNLMDEEEEAEQRMGRRDSFVDDCNQF